MTTTTAAPPAQQTLVAPTTEELNATIARMQARLEQIYGPEKVIAWLEEGEPLPEVRADPAGTIKYRAQISGLGVQRKKDAPSVVKVVLTSRLRISPIKELGDLSEEAEMDIRISPRTVQAGLPLAFGVAAPGGDEIETNITDDTLRARLTALSSRTGELPEDWEQWDQERKDAVGRWCWAMILSASDNQIKIPPVPFDVEEWYWGPEAMAERAIPEDAQAVDPSPPGLREEDAEALRAMAEPSEPPPNGTPALNGTSLEGFTAKPASRRSGGKRGRRNGRG